MIFSDTEYKEDNVISLPIFFLLFLHTYSTVSYLLRAVLPKQGRLLTCTCYPGQLRGSGANSQSAFSLSPAATRIDLKSSQNNNVSSRGSAAPGPDGPLRGNGNLVGTSGAGRRDGKLGSERC